MGTVTAVFYSIYSNCQAVIWIKFQVRIAQTATYLMAFKRSRSKMSRAGNYLNRRTKRGTIAANQKSKSIQLIPLKWDLWGFNVLLLSARSAPHKENHQNWCLFEAILICPPPPTPAALPTLCSGFSSFLGFILTGDGKRRCVICRQLFLLFDWFVCEA